MIVVDVGVDERVEVNVARRGAQSVADEDNRTGGDASDEGEFDDSAKTERREHLVLSAQARTYPSEDERTTKRPDRNGAQHQTKVGSPLRGAAHERV